MKPDIVERLRKFISPEAKEGAAEIERLRAKVIRLKGDAYASEATALANGGMVDYLERDLDRLRAKVEALAFAYEATNPAGHASTSVRRCLAELRGMLDAWYVTPKPPAGFVYRNTSSAKNAAPQVSAPRSSGNTGSDLAIRTASSSVAEPHSGDQQIAIATMDRACKSLALTTRTELEAALEGIATMAYRDLHANINSIGELRDCLIACLQTAEHALIANGLPDERGVVGPAHC